MNGRLPMIFLFALAGAGCGGESGSPAGKAATVSGTLTLPASAAGKSYAVRVVTDKMSPTPLRETTGLTTASTMLPYSIADVPAGTYFLLAFVDVDGSGGDSSTTGDFVGWYGHGGDGNPPAATNAVVPSTGTMTFDWTLVVR